MAQTPAWDSLSESFRMIEKRVRDLEFAKSGLVEMSKARFGVQTALLPSTVTANGVSRSRNVWIEDDGPVVSNVFVASGSLFVQVTGRIGFGKGDTPGSMSFSWELIGETPIGPDRNRALRVFRDGGQPLTGASEISASYGILHTGLMPGSYQVSARYYCDTVESGTPSQGWVTNPQITVIPF